MKHWLVIAATLSLVACGGEDGEYESQPFRVPITPGAGTSPGGGGPVTGSGLWLDSSSGGTDLVALVTEEGDFMMYSSLENGGIRDFFGDGGFTGNTVTASANTYFNFAASSSATLQGTIVEGMTITGSYTAGGAAQAFTLNYFGDLYERAASLATLADMYSDFDGTVVTVQTNGTLAVTLEGGCTIAGAVTVPHSDRNYYRFTGTLSNCAPDNGSISGYMYLMDSATTNDTVALIGQTDARTRSVYAEALR